MAVHVTPPPNPGLTFLFEVRPGACDRSFGVHVATIAKFPPQVPPSFAAQRPHKYQSYSIVARQVITHAEAILSRFEDRHAAEDDDDDDNDDDDAAAGQGGDGVTSEVRAGARPLKRAKRLESSFGEDAAATILAALPPLESMSPKEALRAVMEAAAASAAAATAAQQQQLS
jgi:hypothetical protein